MFDPRKLHFYNYETGKPYPYWFGILWHLTVVLCYIVGIIIIILACYKIGNELKQKSKNEKYQTSSIAISPKPTSISCIDTGDCFSIFNMDTHSATFTKDKDTTNDIQDKTKAVHYLIPNIPHNRLAVASPS